jgi:hypothetical protein
MGLIWEAGVVRTQQLNQIQDLVGIEGADFVAGLLTNIGSQAENIVATIIGMSERRSPRVFFKPSKKSLLTACFPSQ